jgi:Family of unknown function (DUF6461)
MQSTGEESKPQPASRKPWIVVGVVALVFAIEAGAGILAQQGHRAPPAPVAAAPVVPVPASVSPSAAAVTPRPTPTVCISTSPADAWGVAIPMSGDCLTAGDVRAAGCSADSSAPDTARVSSYRCTSFVLAAPAATEPPLPSEPAVPSQDLGPPLAPARDPVVGKLVDWDADDAECVVFFKGRSPDQVVRLMGGNPAKKVPADTDPSESGSNYVAGVGTRQGWTVLSGWNGYSCADPDLLKKWTAGGLTAVTVYWNSDIGTATLSYAADGQILTAWDELDDVMDGTRPHGLDKAKARVAADVADYRFNSAMLAMAASITGVVLPYDWQPSYSVRIPNN